VAVKSRNPKALCLRDFIIGYKRNDPACKYCPTHPLAVCQWNSGNGYYRLSCEKGHSVSIFEMLGNFNIGKYASDPGLSKDLSYVKWKYTQAERHREAPKAFPVPPGTKSKMVELEDDSEDIRDMKPGYLTSSYRIPYTTMGENAALEILERFSSSEKESYSSTSDSDQMESYAEPTSSNLKPTRSTKVNDWFTTRSPMREDPASISPIKEVRSGREISAPPSPKGRSPLKLSGGNRFESIYVDDEPPNKAGKARNTVTPKYGGDDIPCEKATIPASRRPPSPPKYGGDDIPCEKATIPASRRPSPPNKFRNKQETMQEVFKLYSLMDLEDSYYPMDVYVKDCMGKFDEYCSPTMRLNGFSENEISAYKAGDFTVSILYFWYFPPKIGNYTRLMLGPFPTEKDFLEGSVMRCFDTVTRTYTIRSAPKRPATFADAVKSGIPKDYHERLEKSQQQKLRNSDYAVQYLKSGHHPKPLRKTQELGFLYLESKKIKKSEIRTCLRTIGIESGKVVDINFAGNNVTVLTVPTAHMSNMESVLIGKGIVTNSFDPLSQEANKYDKEGKDPTIRFAERLIRMRKNAESAGRPGLANFYRGHLAQQVAAINKDSRKKYYFQMEDETILKELNPVKRLRPQNQVEYSQHQGHGLANMEVL